LLWGSEWPSINHEQFANFEALITKAHSWVGAESFELDMVQNPTQLYWGLGSTSL
jgi:predicted TIM-barrel fold metal-dependent hydrolase